ncbi:hypothetical protein ABZ312_11400 [Streptomyces sp. NPDC006207]
MDALLALSREAALAVGSMLDGVEIVDGPPVVNLTAPDRLHFGWQPDADAAVALEQEFASAGARRRDERFTISGYAESRSGDTNMQARRSRVFEIVAALEDLLRATDAAPEAPTLNGSVLWSELTAGDLRQYQAEGVVAGLNFSIACRARL